MFVATLEHRQQRRRRKEEEEEEKRKKKKRKKKRRKTEDDLLGNGRSGIGAPRMSFCALVKRVPFVPCCRLVEGVSTWLKRGANPAHRMRL